MTWGAGTTVVAYQRPKADTLEPFRRRREEL
jgi:hypothetical protein